MVTSNVIDFVEALQSRRVRQGSHATRAGHRKSRLLRYRDGVDGLAAMQVRPSSAKILPFEMIADRPSA
jgi:hypothetical protein